MYGRALHPWEDERETQQKRHRAASHRDYKDILSALMNRPFDRKL